MARAPRLYSGVDQLGIIGSVAPGISAQPGRCWRYVYVNAVGHAGPCEERVSWQGRHRYASGWARVWSCDAHAERLEGARRLERR
jgi:hypothetical protein